MQTSLRLTGSVLAVLFVALASWIELVGDAPGDEWALVELGEALGTSLDGPMVLLGGATDLLPLGVVGLGLVALLAGTGRRAQARTVFAMVGIAFVCNPILKLLIARPRPDIRTAPEALSTYSFPSGHAASTAAFVGALLIIAPTRRARLRIGIAGGIALVAVGFSRLAVGAHYPSDLVGGWLWIGSLVTFVAAGRAARPRNGPVDIDPAFRLRR